jgi:hypothetical protein
VPQHVRLVQPLLEHEATVLQAKCDRGESIAMPVPAPEPTAPAEAYSFRYDRPDWSVKFENKRLLFHDEVGFFYIASLLDQPLEKFSSTELRGAYNRFQAGPGEIRSLYHDPQADRELQVCLESAEPDELEKVMDRVGYKAVCRKIEQLTAEIDDATRNKDMMEAARLSEEKQRLGDCLFKSFDQKGKPRRLRDKSKNDTDQVRNAINRALETIREKSKKLYRHLNNSLKRGYWCSYEPENPIKWNA